MRSGIHPDYHEIVIETTNGTAYTSRSTWGKAGEKMKLEIDPDTHPAWTGGIQKVLEGGQVARFGRRFQGKSFSASTASTSATTAPKPAAPKPAAKKPEVKADVKKAEAPKTVAPAGDTPPADTKAE